MRMSTNSRFIFLCASYWTVCTVSNSFNSAYMQEAGYSTFAIGALIAVGGLLAALLQPVLGRICDRNPKVTWRGILRTLIFMFAAVCAIMLVVPAKIAAPMMGLLFLLFNLMMPFVHGSAFIYRANGEYVNFGIGRGMGSVIFAGMAFIMGILTKQYGCRIVPLMGLPIVSVLYFALTLMPPTPKPAAQQAQASTSLGSILARYPAFVVMLLATLLMLCANTFSGTYLLQILQSFGGTSRDLGLALAIQALVEVPTMMGTSLLLKRFRSTTLMLIAGCGFVLRAVCFTLAGSLTAAFCCLLTQMFGYAIYASVSVYYAAETIDEADRATGQALVTSMVAASTVLGNLLGGTLYSTFGLHFMLRCGIGMASAALVLAAVSVSMSRRRGKCPQ